MTAQVALPPLSPNGWLRWEVVSRLLPRPDARSTCSRSAAGQGGFGARLAQRFRYVGVEPDGDSCAVAQERLARAAGRGEVHHGDLSRWPSERFDLVCAFEVIEHIEDDRGALRSWADRVRPGGSAAAVHPGLAAAHSPLPTRWSGTSDGTTRRCCAASSDAGLVDVEVVHFGAPLGYLLEAGRNAAGRRPPGRRVRGIQGGALGASGRTLQPSSPLGGDRRPGRHPAVSHPCNAHSRRRPRAGRPGPAAA